MTFWKDTLSLALQEVSKIIQEAPYVVLKDADSYYEQVDMAPSTTQSHYDLFEVYSCLPGLFYNPRCNRRIK